MREMNREEEDSGLKFLEEVFHHFREGLIELGAKRSICKDPARFEEAICLDVLLAITSDLDDSADNVFVDLAADFEVKQVATRIHALWG